MLHSQEFSINRISSVSSSKETFNSFLELFPHNFIIFLMKNPSQLLPLQFSTFEIQPVQWKHFRGQPDQTMPWSAHIYWWIQYNVVDEKKKKVEVNVHIKQKSWVRQQKKCDHLLNHEQGHYLIGCLCALEFLRRVDSKKKLSQQTFEDLLLKTFDRTMKEYLQLQKKYDNETEHRLNFKKQQEWNTFLYDRLSYYNRTYDKARGKFVKFSESPSKNRKNRN